MRVTHITRRMTAKTRLMRKKSSPRIQLAVEPDSSLLVEWGSKIQPKTLREWSVSVQGHRPTKVDLKGGTNLTEEGEN